MAWSRDASGCFTKKQHMKMLEMNDNGLTFSEIADKAGCSTATVGYHVKKLRDAKKKPKSKTIKSKSVKNGKVDDREKDYLAWALQGSMSRIGGVSFIDRLISDIKNGDLG